MGTHNTRKRSQEGEKSQSSSNFPDPKRRRLIDPKREDLKMMDSSDWIPDDKALLTLFGNVRHGDDTTLGRSFDITFFKNVAERLTGSEGTDIDEKDVAWRVRNLRQVFHGNPTFKFEKLSKTVYTLTLLEAVAQEGKDKIPFIKDYTAHNDDTSVNLEIIMTEDQMNTARQEVLEDFFHLRLDFYEKRKKKRTKRVTASTEKTAIRSMGETPLKFLELLAKVCRGEETSIGLPTDLYFWSSFAYKYNQSLAEYWTPEKCELFATALGKRYLNKDSSSDRMSDSFKCLLEEIFVGHATLFPAVAETQVEQEFIQETPPDQLVKRAERSTSSVQNISQSEGSSLSPELEDAVRSWIFLMEEEGMLKLPEIVFAQKYLTKSSWAADIFMRKKNMESKRNYIVKAMKELEEPEMNKKKRSSMGQTSVGFVGLSIGKRVTRYAGEPILGCSKLGVTWSLSMYRLNRYPLVRLPLSHDYPTEALGLASIVVRQAAGGNVLNLSVLVELLIELRDGGSDYLGKGVSKVVVNVNTIIGPALVGKAGASVLKIPLYEGWKLNVLAHFDDGKIQELYESAKREITSFVPMDTGNMGRTRHSEHDAKETANLQQLVEITSDPDEEFVDAIPLKTKVPIIDWKIGYHGQTAWWEII
ncbi:DNA topoisomerase 2 [Tanacetum coccineum]